MEPNSYSYGTKQYIVKYKENGTKQLQTRKGPFGSQLAGYTLELLSSPRCPLTPLWETLVYMIPNYVQYLFNINPIFAVYTV